MACVKATRVKEEWKSNRRGGKKKLASEWSDKGKKTEGYGE